MYSVESTNYVTQFTSAIIVGLALFITGLQTQLMGIKPNDVNYDFIFRYFLNVNRWNYSGLIVGGILLTVLSNMIGRRIILFLSSTINVLMFIFMYFSVDNHMFGYPAWFANGIVYSMLLGTSAIYLSEISSNACRGTLIIFSFLFIPLGGVINDSIFLKYMEIEFVIIANFVISIVPVLGILLLLKESPYYLMMKNHGAKALVVLKYFRKAHRIEDEFNELQTSQQYKYRMNPKHLIAIGLFNLVQFCCMYWFTSTMYILLNRSEYTPLEIHLSEIIAVISSSCLVDTIGRKPVYLISAVGYSIILFCYPRIGPYTSESWISVCLIICVFSYNYGLLYVPYLISTELFNTKCRGPIIGISALIQSILYAISTDALSDKIQAYSDDWSIGMGCTVLIGGIIVSFIFLPETKKHPLPKLN